MRVRPNHFSFSSAIVALWTRVSKKRKKTRKKELPSSKKRYFGLLIIGRCCFLLYNRYFTVQFWWKKTMNCWGVIPYRASSNRETKQAMDNMPVMYDSSINICSSFRAAMETGNGTCTHHHYHHNSPVPCAKPSFTNSSADHIFLVYNVVVDVLLLTQGGVHIFAMVGMHWTVSFQLRSV